MTFKARRQIRSLILNTVFPQYGARYAYQPCPCLLEAKAPGRSVALERRRSSSTRTLQLSASVAMTEDPNRPKLDCSIHDA
ncbi:hypothetical protein CCMA1212_004918 [Trichoderma ghanense]|uniref:Uncharacterized protein n=1 Tax=Trichoderma ghanense TaxID=65468 RepID=A0ABY2H5H1_9HYPO